MSGPASRIWSDCFTRSADAFLAQAWGLLNFVKKMFNATDLDNLKRPIDRREAHLATMSVAGWLAVS